MSPLFPLPFFFFSRGRLFLFFYSLEDIAAPILAGLAVGEQVAFYSLPSPHSPPIFFLLFFSVFPFVTIFPGAISE